MQTLMENEIQLIVLSVLTVFAAIYVLIPIVLSVTGSARKKVVTCPQAGHLAEIELESPGTPAVSAQPQMEVKSCSLWRDVGECKQDCLK